MGFFSCRSRFFDSGRSDRLVFSDPASSESGSTFFVELLFEVPTAIIYPDLSSRSSTSFDPSDRSSRDLTFRVTPPVRIRRRTTRGSSFLPFRPLTRSSIIPVASLLGARFVSPSSEAYSIPTPVFHQHCLLDPGCGIADHFPLSRIDPDSQPDHQPLRFDLGCGHPADHHPSG